MKTELPNKYTLKELFNVISNFVKYIIKFMWITKRKEKEQENRKNKMFNKTIEELKDGYNKIDEAKSENKNKSEKERLDNLF